MPLTAAFDSALRSVKSAIWSDSQNSQYRSERAEDCMDDEEKRNEDDFICLRQNKAVFNSGFCRWQYKLLQVLDAL